MRVRRSAFTIEQLEAIEQAYADGALTVKYSNQGNNKEVTYRSLAEMEKIIYKMKLDLGIIKPGNGLFGGRRLKMKHSKGLSKKC